MADATQDPEQCIRERPYLLWAMEGKPDGRAEEYWLVPANVSQRRLSRLILQHSPGRYRT